MAAFGPTAQAGLNPTEVLEGRAYGCAHEANEGYGAQDPATPLAGL